VIATLVVFEQIEYLQSRDLGFAMDETLVVRAPRVRGEDYGTTFDTFRDQLMARRDIGRISHVTEVPGKQIYWDAGGIRLEGEDETKGKNYQIVGVDYEFADLFELDFVAGRKFSKEFGTEEKNLMVNETALEFLGFENAESAIGQKVDYWGELFTVVGVIKNYHQQSPKMAFEPHLYRFAPHGRGAMGAIAIKLNSRDVRETIAGVKAQYDSFFPGNSFDYFFLDEYYNQQYEADLLFGNVYSIFSIIALCIIALGIYGLTSFSITLLTKEIGIRKVLGASISGVVGFLTREFVILVGIANILAWPIAYFMMNRWLEGFASRMEMGILTFVVAGLSTLTLALLTISFQVIKAARANPVHALRYE
jgi:putative ABC transport system permease protein